MMYIRAARFLVVIAALLLACQGDRGDSLSVRVSTESSNEPGVTEQRSPLSTVVLAELLDAVEAELVAEDVCTGGEIVKLAIVEDTQNDGVLYLFCNIEKEAVFKREAYCQDNGQVILADSLFYRNVVTRYSTHKITDEAFKQAFENAQNRCVFIVSGELSPSRWVRHEQRERRKFELSAQP